MSHNRLRGAVLLYGVLRVGIGAAAMAAPAALTRTWVGDVHPRHAGVALGRAMAARDIALGAGTVASAVTGKRAMAWLLASGGADAADALVTALGWTRLGGTYRGFVLTAAASGALTAAMLVLGENRAATAPGADEGGRAARRAG